MGIVNVTPDSFSDGGRYLDPARALAHARRMRRRRRRPDRRRRRVDAARRACRWPKPRSWRACSASSRRSAREGVAVSVDTRKPAVMRAAIAAGAVDDQRRLARSPRRARSKPCAGGDVGVCLMHMQGEPATMQQAPVVRRRRRARCAISSPRAPRPAWRPASRASASSLDPGFGFGKTLAHNLALLRALPGTRGAGLPGAGRAVAQVVAGLHHRPRRRPSACRRASRRRSPRWRAARRSSACTTCARPSTR